MNKKLRVLLSLLVVFSMLLAACGGGEDPTPTAEPAAPAEAPTNTPEPAPPTDTPEPVKEEPTKAPEAEPAAAAGEAVTIANAGDAAMILLPKFLGIAVFDEANQGAQEAHKELGNAAELTFTGPTAEKRWKDRLKL